MSERENILKRALDFIFKLPPVSQRLDIRKRLITRVACVIAATHEKDDTYIYYQCSLVSFIFCSVINAVFFWMYMLQSDFVIGNLRIPFVTDERYVGFFDQYSKTAAPGLLYAILPFFFVKFLWNLNPRKYNVLWFSPAFQSRGSKSSWKVIGRSLLALLMMFVLMGNLGSAWGWVTEMVFYIFHPQPSIFSIGSFLLVCAWLSSVATMLILVNLVWIWAYIGNTKVSK